MKLSHVFVMGLALFSSMANAANVLTISTPLHLSTTQVTLGQTVTASVTYTNKTSSAIKVSEMLIAGRAPGQTREELPFRDFSPEARSLTIAPGASYTLTATRTFSASSGPTGTWYSYPSYKDSTGAWHEGQTNVYYTVSAAGSNPSPSPSPSPTKTVKPSPSPSPTLASGPCGPRPTESGNGFYVEKGKICDANGNEFRLRGMDKAHFDTDQHAALIAAHANIVRMFMYDIGGAGAPSASSYASEIINEFVANDEIVMLTAANTPGGPATTGNGSFTNLKAVVEWWVANVGAFQAPVNGKVPMDYMLINIANEWGGPTDGTNWGADYEYAVEQLRSAGYTCPLVMDAGQNIYDLPNFTSYASNVFNADSLRNSVFSLHEYDTSPTNLGSIDDQLVSLASSTGAAFIIGEFGPGRNLDGQTATPNEIIAAAESHNLGWIYWAMDDHSGSTGSSSNDWFGACYNMSNCNSATLSSPSTRESLDSTLYTIAGQQVILGCTNATPGGCGCSLPAAPLTAVDPGCSGGTLSPQYSGQGMVDLATPASIFR